MDTFKTPTNSLVVQKVQNPPAMQEAWVRSLGWGDPLEKGITTPSSTLAWRTPWTKEPGGLQSVHVGVQRVGHDWVTSHTKHTNLQTNFEAWRGTMTHVPLGNCENTCKRVPIHPLFLLGIRGVIMLTFLARKFILILTLTPSCGQSSKPVPSHLVRNERKTSCFLLCHWPASRKKTCCQVFSHPQCLLMLSK